MNRMLLIISVVALFVIAGAGVFYLNNQQTAKNTTMQESSAGTDQGMMKNNTIQGGDSMEKTEEGRGTGAYITYSSQALGNAANTKRVLFFYANWCPICRPVDAELQENETKIPKNVTVIRVNYNDPETDEDEKALAKQYAVTYQHTFVLIDEDGKELKKWNGGGLAEIIAMTK